MRTVYIAMMAIGLALASGCTATFSFGGGKKSGDSELSKATAQAAQLRKNLGALANEAKQKIGQANSRLLKTTNILVQLKDQHKAMRAALEKCESVEDVDAVLRDFGLSSRLVIAPPKAIEETENNATP